MSAVSETNPRRGKEWLESWDPNDEASWDSRLAWRTLWVTTYALTLGFITWFLVSALAPKLNSIGFTLSKTQLYWLAAMPGLAGGSLRLVWTFLPPILGTRKLVSWSTILLVVPLIGWAYAVQNPSTPYAMLMLLAFAAGIGGGVFSGFMPSTSYFFPKAKQGTALGLQAGIGNFGVSIVQFVTPWIIGFSMLGVLGASQTFTNPTTKATKEVWYQNAGWVWVPLVAIASVAAWMLLKSVPVKARGLRDQFDIFTEKHTWLMTVLYVLTFGTFSGLAAQFGLLTKNIFGDFANAPDPVKFVFLGPLVGSAARILAGPVTDRLTGGRVTLVSAIGIAVSAAFTATTLSPTSSDDFGPFLWGMLAIFFFTGVGNASTFKQMPMIFQPRQAGGVIGWTGAIAAFGPFIFGVGLASIAPTAFFYGIVGFAIIGAGIAWWFYARPGCEKPG